MRELVSELTPRAGPALSLSRKTSRAVLCVVCGRRACLESCLCAVSLTCSIAMGGGDGGWWWWWWWCDDCVAVGFRGQWWRVCGTTLCVSVMECWWWAGRGLDWYLNLGREVFVPGRCARHWLSPPLFSHHLFRYHHPITPESLFPPSSRLNLPSFSELLRAIPSYPQHLQAPELGLFPKVSTTCGVPPCPSTRSNITSETPPTRRPPPVPCPIPAANGRRAPLDPISPSAIAPAGDETALGAASGFPRQLYPIVVPVTIRDSKNDVVPPAQHRIEQGGFAAKYCIKYSIKYFAVLYPVLWPYSILEVLLDTAVLVSVPPLAPEASARTPKPIDRGA